MNFFKYLYSIFRVDIVNSDITDEEQMEILEEEFLGTAIKTGDDEYHIVQSQPDPTVRN